MLEVVNWVLNLFLNTPVQIIVFVLGAAGVSVLSQVFKKWLKIENERWMFLVVMAIAGLGSLLDWFLNSASLPPQVIGIQTSLLIGIAQPIYFYVVKPINVAISILRANKDAITTRVGDIEKTPVPSVPEVAATLAPSAPTQVTINPVTIATPEAAQAVVAAITPTETTTTSVQPAIAQPEPPRPVASF